MASPRKPLVYRWRDVLAEADDLTTTQRAVGWRSSDYADAQGHGIYPGSVRLARELGMKVNEGATENRVVLKALSVLVARGFLEKVGNGYRGQNAEYRLAFPVQRWSEETTNSEERWSVECGKGGLYRDPTSPLPGGELS